MPNINGIKHSEMEEIKDFCLFIEDYGHIFYADPKALDAPFKKILEGINEIREMIDENYSH